MPNLQPEGPHHQHRQARWQGVVEKVAADTHEVSLLLRFLPVEVLEDDHLERLCEHLVEDRTDLEEFLREMEMTFHSTEAARSWMLTSLPALGNRRPLDLILGREVTKLSFGLRSLRERW